MLRGNSLATFSSCACLCDEACLLCNSTFSTTHPKIVSNHAYYPYFKDCIGALDGIHVNCIVPATKALRFRNRKGQTSQNVLAVVDFDMMFTYMLVGWEGSAHDARVLSSAIEEPTSTFPMPPLGVKKKWLVNNFFTRMKADQWTQYL